MASNSDIIAEIDEIMAPSTWCRPRFPFMLDKKPEFSTWIWIRPNKPANRERHMSDVLAE